MSTDPAKSTRQHPSNHQRLSSSTKLEKVNPKNQKGKSLLGSPPPHLPRFVSFFARSVFGVRLDFEALNPWEPAGRMAGPRPKQLLRVAGASKKTGMVMGMESRGASGWSPEVGGVGWSFVLVFRGGGGVPLSPLGFCLIVLREGSRKESTVTTFKIGGPFILGFVFVLFLEFVCVFQGGWLFGFLALVAFTWVYVAFVACHFSSSAFTVPLCLAFAAFAALAFRIRCITSSFPAGGSLALSLLAAFWLWLLASSAFPVGFWPWLPASSTSPVPLWCPPPRFAPLPNNQQPAPPPPPIVFPHSIITRQPPPPPTC